jgi:TonB family protein
MRQHFRRGSLFVALLALGLGESAMAGPMEDGQAAYDRGDFAEALAQWRPLAEQGVARAQNNLGVLYENGKGVPTDLNEALKWYRLAAEQNYGGAENNLGLIYALGRGVPRDSVRSYMWFSLAASSLSGDIGKTVLESRNVIAGTMTPPQIVAATEMVLKCQAANYKECERADDTASSDSASLVPSTPAVAKTSHAVTPRDYPADSIRFHESGAVTVTYVINEMGSVTKCSVVLSSGYGRLDEAACVMVKRNWKYTPATEDGKPASVQYISKIVFSPR